MRTNQAKIRRRGPAAMPMQAPAEGQGRAKVAGRKPPADLRPVRSAGPGPLGLNLAPAAPLAEHAPPLPTELHFGILLRRARERRGMTMQDVVRVTRIAERWLPALEEARLDLLPAPVFVAGYVRAYARSVGLDEADLAERYHTLVQQRVSHSDGVDLVPRRASALGEAERALLRKKVVAIGCTVLALVVLALVWLLARR